MILSQQQRDNLTEMINIGFSRAANSLSELTGDRILLDVPQIEIIPIEQLAEKLTPVVDGDITTVHQLFKGEVSGDAMLILNKSGSLLLTDLLTDSEVGTHTEFSSSVKEVLIEVGNIILNSCLGMFGNLLKVHFTFSVPELRMRALQDMVSSMNVGDDEIRYALLIFMGFKLKESSVNGHLVIVLGVNSLEKMLNKVDNLENLMLGQ